MEQKIALILLGAGRSSRFGADKRQHKINGVCLIEHTIKKYLQLDLPLMVVLRDTDEKLAAELKSRHLTIEILLSKNAKYGMGHSVSDAISEIEKKPQIEKIVMALADMPYIKIATLNKIIEPLTLKQHDLVVPIYQQTMGHPVGFGRRYFDVLKQLTGDKGAKHILLAHEQDLLTVPVCDAGVLADIDTPEDVL